MPILVCTRVDEDSPNLHLGLYVTSNYYKLAMVVILVSFAFRLQLINYKTAHTVVYRVALIHSWLSTGIFIINTVLVNIDVWPQTRPVSINL